MRALDLDENGWASGAVAALPLAEAWTLLSPDASARVDAARWAHQARTFFQQALSVAQDKRYPAGTFPLADALDVEALGARVRVVTLPADRCPEALRAGALGAQAIGGAGFDALVPRTRRVWQIVGTSEPAPLLVAAVLASLFLAPVVPPGGGTIFGVKGARERLAALGVR
jgi:hypothetical protein